MTTKYSTKLLSGLVMAARDLQAQRQAHLDAAGEIEATLKRWGIAPASPPRRKQSIRRIHLRRERIEFSHVERKVLELVRSGLTEQEVGRSLGRSVHTVHVHVKNIYRKIGIHSRHELLEWSGF